MSQHNWQAILAALDEREANIKQILPYLKQMLSSPDYQSVASKYAQELIQMNVRRRIIAALLTQTDTEEEGDASETPMAEDARVRALTGVRTQLDAAKKALQEHDV